MQLAALISLVVSILFLTAYGAGIFVWTVCLVAMLLSAVAILNAWRNGSAPSTNWTQRLLRPRSLFFAFFLFVLLTLIPLPFPLTVVTGNKRYEQNKLVVEAVEEASRLEVLQQTPATWFSTSRNRAGTMRIAILLIAAFGAAYASSILTPRQKVLFLRFLMLLGALVAIPGYLGKWVYPQGFRLWWIVPISHSGKGAVAGFTHANHFAGFIGVTGLISLAFIFNDSTRRRWFFLFLSACAFAIITLCLIFSQSRAAFVLYFASVAVMTLFMLCRTRLAVAVPVVLLLLLLASGALAIALQRESVRNRIATLRRPFDTESFYSRSRTALSSIDMWKTYPLIGIGADAFRNVYPAHKTTSERASFMFAENEYAQFLCEFGSVGVLLILGLACVVVRQMRRSLRDDACETVVPHAACGALLMAGMQSATDFIMHLPLYSLLVFSILGLIFSQSPRKRGFEETGEHYQPISLPGVLGLSVAVVMCFFMAPMQRFDSWGYLAGTKPLAAGRAMVWAPTCPLAWRRFGIKIAEASDASRESREFGERCLTQAARYDPRSPKLWLRLGKLRLEIGDTPGAREAFARVKELKPWMGTPAVP